MPRASCPAHQARLHTLSIFVVYFDDTHGSIAGLLQVVSLAGRSKSHAERIFDFPESSPLVENDAGLALTEGQPSWLGIAYTPAALQTIYSKTRGYPYSLQGWAIKRGRLRCRRGSTTP